MTELSQDYLYRFGGIGRLYGSEALALLSSAHFAVIGLGGVGSWAAEALARSGVGTITLIELDDICTTNTNRQIQALSSTVGQSKNTVIAARLRDINPDIVVHQIQDFLDRKNLAELILPEYDVVLDAIDAANVKAALAAYCSARKIRLVMVGSSGGKANPTQICVDDLARTEADPMLAKIRGQLYRHHGLSKDRGRKFRIDAVYSKEQMRYPKPDGTVCMDKGVLQQGVKLDCTGGFGSSMMVTASFGITAAATGIERYLNKKLNIVKKN